MRQFIPERGELKRRQGEHGACSHGEELECRAEEHV